MIKNLLLAALLSACGYSYAGKSPLSPSLYYEMGGGVSFQRPLSEATIAPELAVSLDLDLPLSCDIWDVKDIAVENYPDLVVDYLEGQLDQLGQAVVAQLASIGQGIAVAALQRALPGIYDLSQTLTAQINARVDIAKRSCEDVVNDVHAGINPLDPWKKIGVSLGWRQSLTGDTNVTQPIIIDGDPNAGGSTTTGSPADATSILDAQRLVAANGTEAPIPWFGTTVDTTTGATNAVYAGNSANPILVVEDLVTAGYNVFLNSPTLDDGTATANGVTAPVGDSLTGGPAVQRTVRLGEMFPNATDANAWANRFIGEQEIYTCAVDDGCISDFKSGVGLQVMVNEESERLYGLWSRIIAAEIADPLYDPSIDELTEVSSESVQVSVSVFQALMRFPVQDQNVYIGRLISDVSLARTVEKAMAIRRMILVSSESPLVRGYAPAAHETNKLIERIRVEIEDTMWAVETQAKLTSTAAGQILSYDAIRFANARNVTSSARTNTVSTFIGDRPEIPVPTP